MKQIKLFTLTMIALLSMATGSSCSSNDTPDENSNGGTETPDYTLTGSITSDKILEKDQTYILSGDYTVKSGATLKIPAGVTIVAKNDAAVHPLCPNGAALEQELLEGRHFHFDHHANSRQEEGNYNKDTR